MEYLDGVRKLYGKVKIVYADKDVSKELKVTVSGDSDISNKEQVVLGYTEPSIKACTMDGNATMNGTFKMRDGSQVCGWWSRQSSDGVGNFSAPFPYLDVSFIDRPIIEWLIIADAKLNQYPVKFAVICYNRAGNELARQEFDNNDKTLVNIKFNIVPIGVTRIRLEIHKWNKPNAKAKILSFYTLLEEDYGGSDIKDFEVVQELSEQTDNVTYGISSDTATITILNKDRKFDRGYLKELVLLDRKVIPYIGIEKDNGEIEYTQLGEFYSDEWKIPQDDSFAKVVCVDKLIRLQDITYLGYPLTEKGSLYDVVKDILTKAGYTDSQYNIDESTREMQVDNLYLPKASTWDSLQEVLASGLLKGYINKQGKLVVASDKSAKRYDYLLTTKHILRYSKSDKMTDFANQINVAYSDVTVDDTIIKVFESFVIVDALGETKVVLDYNGIITNAEMDYKSQDGLELVTHNKYPTCSEVIFKNTTDKAIFLQVAIKGNAIKITTQNVVVEDKESIERFGVKSYNHNTSFLVQSYDKAMEIGNKLLERLSMRAGRLDIDFRGDPSLELEQEFECINRYGDKSTVVCEFNRYAFDGGLVQQTKGRIK